MYKDFRYVNAGTNEFYRWGKKAVAKVEACKTARNGFYSILADGDKYWTIGTSEGKFGEFAKFGDTFFSVNKAGFVWAKEGTPKADAFLAMLDRLIADMKERHAASHVSDEEDEDYID